jgi:hypothetical protein
MLRYFVHPTPADALDAEARVHNRTLGLSQAEFEILVLASDAPVYSGNTW